MARFFSFTHSTRNLYEIFFILDTAMGLELARNGPPLEIILFPDTLSAFIPRVLLKETIYHPSARV